MYIEIKHLLKNAYNDMINRGEVYMKGIDHINYYENYTTFMSEELEIHFIIMCTSDSFYTTASSNLCP